MGANITILAHPQDVKTVEIVDGEEPVQFYFAKEYEIFSKKKREKLLKVKHAVVKEYRLYTMYQGILVGSCKRAGGAYVFNKRLAHCFLYDIEVYVEAFKGDGTNASEFHSFLTCKIQCSVNPPVIRLSSLLRRDKRLAYSPWVCKNRKCRISNYSQVPICKSCYTHKLQETLGYIAMVPGIGIPFGAAVMTLKWGKACETKAFDDAVDAILETLLLTTNIVLTPLLVSNIVLCFSRIIVVNGASTLGEFIVKFPYQAAFNLLLSDEGLEFLVPNRTLKLTIVLRVFDVFSRVRSCVKWARMIPPIVRSLAAVALQSHRSTPRIQALRAATASTLTPADVSPLSVARENAHTSTTRRGTELPKKSEELQIVVTTIYRL